MKRIRWDGRWLLPAVLLLASCQTATPAPPPATAAPTAAIPPQPTAIGAPTATAGAATPEAAATTAPTPRAISRLFERLNLAPIELLTPTENAGHYPKFEWRPVPGASRYLLLLMDDNGRAYWAWEGSKTAVFLGGSEEAPAEDRVGPILLRPMRWMVVAFNAAGKPIASSPIRPIAP